MAKHTILLYGEFIPYQSSDVQDWGCINLKSVADQLNNAGDADEIEVRIHSNGGDVNEGFAIHDLLVNSGKKITTIIDGNCYSIATVAFMAGSTRYISKNAEFMIHNPWGGAMGNAEELQKYTDQVKDAEQRILNFYVEKTGGDIDQIKAMMDGETFIKANDALELKFATDIMQPVLARIKAHFKNNNISNNKEMNKISESITAGFNEIKNLLTKKFNIKNEGDAPQAVMVKTDSGEELDVTMAGEKIAVGDTLKKGGEDFTGTATLEDGTVITCDAGIVTEVVAPSADDVTALQTENDELKAKLNEQETQLKAFADQLSGITNHLKNLKTTYKVPGASAAFNSNSNAPVEKTLDEVRASREAAKAKLASK